MKPSKKMLILLKQITSEYMKAIETGEEDYVVLNAYMSILATITKKYLEYKRKGK